MARNPYRCQIYGYRSELPCGRPATVSHVADWLREWVLRGQEVGIRPPLCCNRCWLAMNKGKTVAYDTWETK